jgi:hypothetical protein
MWWPVSISFWEGTTEPNEIESWVEAPGSRLAVIVALASIDVNEDELIHRVHVGPPRENKPDK